MSDAAKQGEVSFGLTMVKPDAKVVPLVTIVEGDLTFICDLLKWSCEWVKTHDLEEAVVRNTPEGHYQIVATRKQK